MSNTVPTSYVGAGVARRALTYVIDGLIASPLMGLMAGLASVVLSPSSASTPPITLILMMIPLIVVFAVVPTMMGGQTIGQRAMKVWVVDGKTGQVPSNGALVIRGLTKYFLTAGLCLPFSILGFFMGKNPLPDFGGYQGAKDGGKTAIRFLHDRITDTWAITPQ